MSAQPHTGHYEEGYHGQPGQQHPQQGQEYYDDQAYYDQDYSQHPQGQQDAYYDDQYVV
jgi:hypothetical protein